MIFCFTKSFKMFDIFNIRQLGYEIVYTYNHNIIINESKPFPSFIMDI